MTRLTLLVILVVWMSWSKQAFGPAESAYLPPAAALSIFFGVYAAAILFLRAWARLAVRRSSAALFRYQRAMHFARFFIPTWLGVGVYLLDWGPAVEFLCHRLYAWPRPELHVELPQALLGIFPAIFTWAAFWWSGFPVEVALREQSVLVNLNDDLPVHAPPSFRQTLDANLRLQVGFTLVPVLGLLLIHDVMVACLDLAHVKHTYGAENLVMFPAMLAVFLLAPELLRRTLQTERLPDSPLRRRLEQMCRDVGLKYRDILLWRTGDTMGNAAVMGMLPRVRYVLLSDLLLETMTDEQVEAVFAHELGHVVHRHLMWFGVYALLTLAFMAGPGTFLVEHLKTWFLAHWSPATWDEFEGLIAGLISFGSFALAFGYLSPKFERQADVYAARTMQSILESPNKPDAEPRKGDAPGLPALRYEPRSFVGEHGAALVASALNRVAAINHIPVSARNWSHGSIATRMRALLDMSAHPERTHRFDRFMRRLYASLVALIFAFGLWAVLTPDAPQTPTPPTATRALPPARAAR